MGTEVRTKQSRLASEGDEVGTFLFDDLSLFSGGSSLGLGSFGGGLPVSPGVHEQSARESSSARIGGEVVLNVRNDRGSVCLLLSSRTTQLVEAVSLEHRVA